MKTKVLTLIALAAIVTLSFTFTTENKNQPTTKSTHVSSNDAEPVGGFVSDAK